MLVIENRYVLDFQKKEDKEEKSTLHARRSYQCFAFTMGTDWWNLQKVSQKVSKQPSQYKIIEVENIDIVVTNGVDAFLDIYLRDSMESCFLEPGGELILTYHHNLMHTIWF